MTKKVMNSASPVSTWFDGVVAIPSAWRKIDNTMMMRVKAVIASSIAGSSVSTVIKISTCSVSEYVCAPSAPVLIAIAGSAICAWTATTGSTPSSKAANTVRRRARLMRRFPGASEVREGGPRTPARARSV